jgi:hypothetical protein
LPGVSPLQLTQQGIAKHALQDYQMQLMLLEQQNKKRLLMARQKQRPTTDKTPTLSPQLPSIEAIPKTGTAWPDTTVTTDISGEGRKGSEMREDSSIVLQASPNQDGEGATLNQVREVDSPVI